MPPSARATVSNPFLSTFAGGLTGTKLGCGEGGCGACTVMLSVADEKTGTVTHKSVNACLFPALAADGHQVVTVEGVGNRGSGLHAIQDRIASMHGSQCGFCTPGIVMALYSHLRNTPEPTAKGIEEALDGNLCRCTGYRPILDAAKTFAVDCKAKAEAQSKQEVEAQSKQASSNQQQGPAFPKELKSYNWRELTVDAGGAAWHRPLTLRALLDVMAEHKNAKIVVGNTEVGIEVRFKTKAYPVLVSPARVPELNSIRASRSRAAGLDIGAAVDLTSVGEHLADVVASSKTAVRGGASFAEHETGFFQAAVSQLRWFSSTQIRNAGCVGGNIVTASPISDLCPVFLAADSQLRIASVDADSGAIQNRTAAASTFFKDYRTVDLRPGEVLVSVSLPLTRELEFVRAYKQAKRREDDIAIVTCCLWVAFDKSGAEHKEAKVASARLAFGGVWKTPTRAARTEKFLAGRDWNEATLRGALSLLAEDFPLGPSTPGGMPKYRMTLCGSFFYKFFVSVSKELASRSLPSMKASPRDLSACKPYERPVSTGSQSFESVPAGSSAVVGRSLPHTSAQLQVSGEAKYLDDRRSSGQLLHAALVTSREPSARLLGVDAKRALAVPGVRAFLSAKDIRGENAVGHVGDEELFASKEVHCVGQLIGIVVADSHALARRAANLVDVKYESKAPVLSIREAIESKSFLGEAEGYTLHRGDRDSDGRANMKGADHVISGEMYVGGQEHFYLETHASEAVPKEAGAMEIHASTQNPHTTVATVARVLGVPVHKLVCRVKRMGGGFGGKETRSVNYSAAAALAAAKLGRPVRIVLERNVDICTSGQRHPFFGRYRVGFKSTGQLVGLDVDVYSNGGWCQDLSIPVMHRCVFHIENTYFVPNLRVTGRVCRTNLPSNTAFRGFGGPQGLLICESAMDHVARHLGLAPHAVRQANLYRSGQMTHFGQRLDNCTIRRIVASCLTLSDHDRRRERVAAFNKANRWRKRGIAMIPTKFGIAFTAKFMNQGGALVHVYTDGSVLVTHGGTEMGQGLHTKMIQIAAQALGVPPSRVHVDDTATDKVPNTSPTAASMSSDINGMAVKRACDKIMERLRPYRQKNPSISWDDLVNQAYFDRVNLSAQGFYKVPNVGYDFKTQSGPGFSYFSYGAAVSEVEVDVLTGDHTVLRSDIVMDVGNSLNPALDVGQIEGAFTQGYGLFTLEEMVWGNRANPWLRKGHFLTSGPGNYKIPSSNDVPLDLRVHLLKNAPNEKAIHSSKAVGEPPLFLAASVFFAIKDALADARADEGFKGPFQINSPATSERIRMAAPDSVTKAMGVASAYSPTGCW